MATHKKKTVYQTPKNQSASPIDDLEDEGDYFKDDELEEDEPLKTPDESPIPIANTAFYAFQRTVECLYLLNQ